MAGPGMPKQLVAGAAFLALATAVAGCQNLNEVPEAASPTPQAISTTPVERIAPGSVLRIEASRVIPLPPYRVEPLDVLYLAAKHPRTGGPDGLYPVEPTGIVELGPACGGAFPVRGMTIEQIQAMLHDRLQENAPTVSLAECGSAREVAGHHVVHADGTIGVGRYGKVKVEGMTLVEASEAIDHCLSRSLYRPEIVVSLAGPGSGR